MVKLDNSDGDSLKLLCFQHHLLEDRVLDDLVGDNRGEMARFSHIPPVITVEGRIQVVSQALKDLVELLLFKIGVFQVHSNFLVLTRHTQVSTVITIFVELSLPEPIYVVEYLTWVLVAHKIHTGSVRKLAFHEKLGVFPALSLQLHLFLVHRLETGRQLGLRLVPVEGPRRVLPFPWLLRILLLIVSSGVLRGRSESRIIEIVFLRSLATLVEWVLATLVLAWLLLNLQTSSDSGIVCAAASSRGQHLLSIVLENARQLNSTTAMSLLPLEELIKFVCLSLRLVGLLIC